MAHNRPIGNNGPHMVIEKKIIENFDFNFKFLTVNFCCNKTGNKCDIKWA